ncbi:ion channel [Rheinheimera sp.]
MGYGDITPIGVSRLVAAVEAFTGSFTIALFVVVFVKKMTR